MKLDAIARIAILAGVAIVATPLLHGDTAPFGQSVRPSKVLPQETQTDQPTKTPPAKKANQDTNTPVSNRRPAWKAIAEGEETDQTKQPSKAEPAKKPTQGATTPMSSNQRSGWRVVAEGEETDQIKQPAKTGNGTSTQIKAPAQPASGVKTYTPGLPRSGQAPASNQTLNQNYWSPNQPQKMSDGDWDSSKKANQNMSSPNKAAPANTNLPNTPKPNDPTHPANYYKTEDMNLLQKAKENPSLSTFISALEAAGLADQISNGGPFTIFAPSNEAFRQLPRGTLERLMRPENERDLYMLISYHIAPGKVEAKDAKNQKLRTLNGRDLDMAAARGTLTVDDAEVIRQDIQGKNGVIHVIDAVLLPDNQ